VHQDTVLEAEVDVFELRPDEREVRRSAPGGHVVTDQTPARPDGLDGVRHGASDDGAQPIGHVPKVWRDGRKQLLGRHRSLTTDIMDRPRDRA